MYYMGTERWVHEHERERGEAEVVTLRAKGITLTQASTLVYTDQILPTCQSLKKEATPHQHFDVSLGFHLVQEPALLRFFWTQCIVGSVLMQTMSYNR